jgi:hypothetical protein
MDIAERIRALFEPPPDLLVASRKLRRMKLHLLEAQDAVEQADYELAAARSRVHSLQVRIGRLTQYLNGSEK